LLNKTTCLKAKTNSRRRRQRFKIWCSAVPQSLKKCGS